MTHYLPICLNLEGRTAVIVGGGRIGTQKAGEFFELGAQVIVIEPNPSSELRGLQQASKLQLIERGYQAGDLQGAFLIVAATNDPAINAEVYLAATATGQLVNVCDDPPHCNFIFASRIERGPLTLSVFTHGTSPAFSRRVRRELEAWLGPEYGELALLLAELRPEVKSLDGFSQPDRQRIFERIVYSEALLLFREGRAEEARRLARFILQEEVARQAGSIPGNTPDK